MLANGMVDNPSENAPRAVIDAVIAEHRAGVSRAAAAS
jgi:hypothetical protein